MIVKTKLSKHDIFIRRIKRLIDLDSMLDVEDVYVENFCSKHDISERTLKRDIEVLKYVDDDAEIIYNSESKSYNLTFSEQKKKISCKLTASNIKVTTVKKRKDIQSQRIYRIMCLYKYLNEKNKIKIKTCCDMFEVTARTLRRDIKVLSEAWVSTINQLEGFYYNH